MCRGMVKEACVLVVVSYNSTLALPLVAARYYLRLGSSWAPRG
jgi:hypothetical protein